MVRKIADLQAATDDELIAEHDAHAVNTSVGTQYYLDELNRRAADRAAKATDELTHKVYVLTWVNAAVAVIAAVAAVIAHFK
jgi:hypothetical protein